MPVSNADIATLLNHIGDLLDIQGANRFRVRAYHNAARTVAALPRRVADMVAAGEDLAELPGIGDDLAAKITVIATTGHLPLLDRLEHETPPGVADLLQIEGLGPKRVHALHESLGVDSLAALAAAAQQGLIRSLRGFSQRMEQKILEALRARSASPHRINRTTAEEISHALLEYLARTPGVKHAVAAGSFRRCRDTVGDLDLLVTCAGECPVMERFVQYDDVATVSAQGKTRATVILRNGLQVDLRLVPEVSYGAALHYFTGSKAHNVALRTLGVKRGLRINEYGVFRGERRIAGHTEEEIFAAVGLPYIPPELREDRGEIEAAQRKRLPRLLELGDIRGDLHVHSKASDGTQSIAEIAETARSRGYDYVAIADHSQRVTVAHGLDAKRLARQLDEIDRLNARLRGITVLKSMEVDILEDGTLDMDDRLLRELDFTVCAVHSRFDLAQDRQTERIIRAMDNPNFTILAHPTGRLIGQRAPYALDMTRIIRAAAERRCHLEVNAQPERLDLHDEHCRMARDAGVKLAISSDAHNLNDFGWMRLGVDQARRGWVEADDVINTRKLADLRKLLRRR